MKLSLIVPVYNVEKYLPRCLESLVNQTLVEDFEILIINDGSPDNCQRIIDEYQGKDKRIKSYQKPNGGISDARNFGLKYAKGEYVSFLDSDDYVEPDYYKNMLELAEKENSDLVVADFEYVWEGGTKNPYTKKGLSDVTGEMKTKLFLSPLFSWNKLYKKTLFDEYNLQYPINYWYEDIPVTLKVFSLAKKISYYNKIGVHYVQRKSSIMASSYSEKMNHIFNIFELVIKDFKENGTYDLYEEELEYLSIEHIVLYGSFRFLKTEHYKDLLNKSFSFMREYFPNYKKNKLIKSLGIKNFVFICTISLKTASLWRKILNK